MGIALCVAGAFVTALRSSNDVMNRSLAGVDPVRGGFQLNENGGVAPEVRVSRENRRDYALVPVNCQAVGAYRFG